MEASTKKILGTLAVVAAVGGGFYLIKKGRKLLTGAKMNFALLGFRIHKMNLQEVQFAVKLRCYNPTKAPIKIAINQVVANYKGSPVAFSTPDIKGLTIDAGGSKEPEILFQVPYMNLMGKGLTLQVLSNTEMVKKDMTFTMTISINGETITTTQNLSEENMNGLAIGELGIVSGPRNTQNGKKFNPLVKRAAEQEEFIKNGNVIETVENCIDIIASHYREVEELASMLRGENLRDTCRNIFDFSYKYLQYHKDEDGTEQLRTPSRSWFDGQIRFKQKGKTNAGIDCDDYSIFVGSLLKCLGIPFKLRITKYDGKKNFQHIYVFVPAVGDSEDEIVIDPVLSKFDYQKPYSFEKSNFNMSPLQMVTGISGIDGLTGSTSLGLPISILSGIDLAGGYQMQADHEDLMAIVSGVDFDETVNGLGDPDNATYRYLIRTRDFLLKNKDNKSKMAHVQNPDQFISMLDQAIRFWNSPKRDAVLDKLADIEEKLAEQGLIKYDSEAIQGLAELDELDDELDGLGWRRRRRGRFFKALKRVGKKVGKGVKKGVKKVGKVAKKVVKAIVRFNPLSIAIRGGLLAALRLNMFGIARKLQYAYLPDHLASKYNIDPSKLAKLKRVHGKVKKLFNGLQGKQSNLRKAILKGAKQRSSDFSIKGLGDIVGELQALEAIGELAELGNMGAVATGASVGAASGVLAKIGSWLKPVKNLFTKIRGKAAVKKIAKLTSKGKEISEKLQQRANNYQQQTAQQAAQEEAFQQQIQQQQQNQQNLQEQYSRQINQNNNSVPPKATLPPPPSPTRKSGNYTKQSTTAPIPTATTKKKISKGAKIGIGIGVAALIGTGAYFMFRKKDNAKNKKTANKKAPVKQDLGIIALQ